MKLTILVLALLLINACSLHGYHINREPCLQNKNCKLPKCNCENDKIPIGLDKKFRLDQIPQLVVLTIDDQEMDYKSYQVYKKLFESLLNPNGCPIQATFFVSDSFNKTSYCLVRNLYENGHEIAISTLNNECPHKMCSSIPTFEAWDFRKWTQQILQMRANLERFADIPRSELVGFRAPLVEPSANLHYRIIASHKFLYDSSLMLNSEKIVWPFTFDYQIRTPFVNNGPTEAFSGLWEMPLHIFLDSEGKACMKVWEGHCKYDSSASGVAKFYRQNFLRSYYNNRAPFVIDLFSEWLKLDFESDNTHTTEFHKKQKLNIPKKFYKNLEGVLKFINGTLQHNHDVYFVTANQAIGWVQRLAYIMENHNNTTNLTKALHEYLESTVDCPVANYDAKCEHLLLKSVDFNKTELLRDLGSEGEDEEIEAKTLIELQSELLFFNDVIGYLLFFLIISFIAIFIYDKLY